MLGKLAFYYFWAPNFNPRFTVHKSDVITDKDGCDMFILNLLMVTKLKY